MLKDFKDYKMMKRASAFASALFCILYSVSFLLVPSNLCAQNNPVKVEIDSNKRVIGDKITVKVTAIQKKGEQVLWNHPSLTAHQLELIDSVKIDTIKNGDEITYKQEYHITGFDSGRFYFPSFQFAFIKSGAKDKKIINTDSLAIFISRVPVDTAQPIKPIKEPVPIPDKIKNLLWYYILGGLALIAIALAIFFLIRSRKKKGEFEKIQLKPPYEEAMLAIEKLRKDRLWEKGEVKEYYTAITDILRRYISRRWNNDAFEMTTAEIMRAIKREKVEGPERRQLKAILELADLVKFAKHLSVPEENTRALEQASAFINATRPVETGIDDNQNVKRS